MNPSKFRFHPVAAVLAGALSTVFPVSSAQAYELVWDGSGDSDSWFYSNNNLFDPNTNWINNDVVPTAGDSLVFAGNTRLTPFNDALPGLVVGGMTFAAGAGAFQLNGNAINSTGNITNLSNNLQTINMPISVSADQIWDGGAAGLAVNGLLTLGNHKLLIQNHTAVTGGVLNVGENTAGPASLTLASGSSMINHDSFIGKTSAGNTSAGSVTVKDADSAWNLNNLYIANGTLSVESGGKVSTQNVLTGDGKGSVISVSGQNSSLTGSILDIASVGNGTLTIANGGKVSSQNAGLASTFEGLVTVSGQNSLWEIADNLFLGNQGGLATLNVDNNGTVTAGTLLQIGYNSQVNIQGGGQLKTTISQLFGSVNVTGTGSSWLNSGNLNIGIDNVPSTLLIKNGGHVTDANAVMADSRHSDVVVNVTGAGSLWANSGDLVVGNFGQATLNIENNGEVSVGKTLSIGELGILNLNGGTLSVKTPDITPSAGGQFNWTSGTLNVTGGNGVSLGNNPMFGAVTTLTAGKTLAVKNTLSVNAGNFLLLNGGQVKAGILDLTGGNIAAIPTTGLNMSGIGKLNGYGSVAAAIKGGDATNVIQANGGSLTLGDLNSNTGFDYGGKLDVGSNQVALLDKDKAQLGAATSIADGGKLSTINGADLGSGEALSYTGNASILGDFTNNGEVSGSGGTLTFLNDVNGAGGFSGDIAFHGGYNPGNSPAAINFHGGDISFNATSVLTMEIFGNTPGSEYDQLLNIDHFDFNGTLALVFGGNFTPSAGSSFNLFGFNSFSGSFADNRITVTGIDRALLDFSALTSNGRLQVAAVPLPAAFWLMAAGLMSLVTIARRRV